MSLRDIPSDIKRSVRRESYYGCVVCGTPIIEYHHIEPYHIVKCHEVHNLVALCPNHHRKAGNGTYSKEYVYKMKQNPFNKNRDNIRDDFMLGDYDKFKFKIGSNYYENIETIIMVKGKPLLEFKKDEFGNVAMNALFYDSRNDLIAEIKNNEWITYLKPKLWDVTYSGGKLKINSDRKKVLLEFRPNPEEQSIDLKAKLYYQGNKIDITPDVTSINADNEFGIHFSNCTIADAKVAFFIE
ncbi:HNH endonuclease [Shimazuella sp. AN120528]|uniref:HNH endonuclease signature motif containing protein n=1 Tax=Shimazuella soli TaxID=1892854 RepID=UPI001F0CDFFA|nr:HNH endonuclease [Shimazuella soli]MCH5586025.1 HNH endonuclease [Shimazuella soli]